MSEIGKRVGRRIRELRTGRSKAWTQEDLAERAGISVSFLSMIERGERVAHLETLESVAAALGVKLVDFFDGQVPEGAGADPVLRPLYEFARSRRLTARDVEKLLGVARTMFRPA